jgi:hypothetical protein
MSQHTIRVDEADDQHYDASCSCGWVDPGYEEEGDAEYAAELHSGRPE